MFFTNVSYILLSFGPLESPSTLFIEKKKQTYAFECQNDCNKRTDLDKDVLGKRLNRVRF